MLLFMSKIIGSLSVGNDTIGVYNSLTMSQTSFHICLMLFSKGKLLMFISHTLFLISYNHYFCFITGQKVKLSVVQIYVLNKPNIEKKEFLCLSPFMYYIYIMGSKTFLTKLHIVKTFNLA